MAGSSKQQVESVKRLEAFVSFPSPYTQSLLIQALVGTLPSISISLLQKDGDPAALQWADYDLLSFDKPHSCPSQGKYMISSYIYRKALIRKHQLHQTIVEYLSKCKHRNIKSILDTDIDTFSKEEGEGGGGGGGIPKGWVIDIQFADELDELLQDDLYDLSEVLNSNEEHEQEGDRQWFILKPGFADRAQGIRLFSTEDQLRDIFESFEPPSDDDEYDDEDEEDGDGEEEEEGEGMRALQGGIEGAIDHLAKKAIQMGFDPTSEFDHEEEDGGTGVMTSQLRHFVIQEYLPRPVLFDIAQIPSDPLPTQASGHKFHLRAYVLITGGYTVHLSRTMLALFAGDPYTSPSAESLESGEEGLRAHLTNTCLQTDAYGAPTPPENLVKLLWELEGLSSLSYNSSASSTSNSTSSTNGSSRSSGEYKEQGVVTKEWLEKVFVKVGKVISECVKAGEECGSFGLQFMPNAFEILGVDLILSFPPSISNEQDEKMEIPLPRVTLLEFNASPDFHQSGDRLRPRLLEMFKGVINISIKPFFGITDDEERPEETEEKVQEKEWEVGDERWGWMCVGRGKVRGSNW